MTLHLLSVSFLKIICFVFIFVFGLAYSRTALFSDAVHKLNSYIRGGVYLDYRPAGGVLLIGDSLIRRSCRDFHLIERIQSQVIEKDFGYTNLGEDGNTIAKIRERLPDILDSIAAHNNQPSPSPTLVILLWDSDVSDTDFSALSKKEEDFKRRSFEEDVRHVVHALQREKAHVLGISGPGVLFRNADDFLKHSHLDEYAILMAELALETRVSYIDIRTPFKTSLLVNPTVDGEHPSAAGVEVIARLFAERINTWIEDAIL